MNEEAPDEQKSSERPMSNLLRWVSKTKHVATKSNVATSVVIVLCFIAAHMFRNRKAKKTENSRPACRTFHRSLSLASLHGGETAMQRLLDAQHAQVPPTALMDALEQLKKLLAEESLDFYTMQGVVAKLEMSGEETKTLEMLQKALDQATKNQRNHEAYELEMLKVEMLIYKGEYARALACRCFEHREISDARRPLYEAIIQYMLGNKERAEKFWDEYQEIRSRFQQPKSSPINEMSRDFGTFQNAVDRLRQEVEDAHKKHK